MTGDESLSSRLSTEDVSPITVTDSGNAEAAHGGVANTGVMTVEHHHHPALPTPTWPVRVGQIPALASAYQPRPGLRKLIAAARAASTGTNGDSGDGDGAGGVVLTQVLSGGGGVGKSQLAASYADQAIRDGTDLVVWVDASAPGGLVTGYAQAAARVQAPGASGQPADVESDARMFLDWAAATKKSWLAVLYDITDPDQAAAWWPASHTGTGWVLATTRHRDPVLSGAGRRVVDVDVYEDTKPRPTWPNG